jgi:outer membrane protein assembly factor BamB
MLSLRSSLVALAFASASVLSFSAESPMFHGNPALTGVYPAPTKAPEGKIAWSFEAMSWGLYQTLEDVDGQNVFPTTPALSGGRLYFAAGPFLFAIDGTGKQVFRTTLSANSLASPAVVDGVVYVPSNDGKLAAFSAADGSPKWTAVIGQPSMLKQVDNWDVYQSSPIVVDGVVYIGSTDGRLYALSAKDGSVKWSFQTKGIVRATPAVSEGRVVFGSWDGQVYALDAASGKALWQFNTKVKGYPWNSVQGSCAIEKGIVYVGSRSAFFYALDAATGKQLYQDNHEGNWVTSSPAVRDGVAYFGQSDGCLITAVGQKGEKLWVYKTPTETFSSPVLAGEVLYVAGNSNYDMHAKGFVSALEAKTGKVLWTLEMPASVWANPVVGEDCLYVACADGRVYSVK